MSEPANPKTKLLHADEEQIDRAAISIADGTAFVIAVCSKETRAAARSRLSLRLHDLLLPAPIEIGNAEEMLSALTEQATRPDRCLSIEVTRDVAAAFDALNLHREKVLAGGPVFLWLDDVEALRLMRERAPDAYSFRTTMMLVQGDGGRLPAILAGEEPEKVATAKKRWKRAKAGAAKAAAGLYYADALRKMGRLELAEEIARAALLESPNVKNDQEREVRAQLCDSIGASLYESGRLARSMEWRHRALAELQIESLARELAVSVLLLADWPGPFGGRDRIYSAEALRKARNYGLSPIEMGAALRAAAHVALAQGNLSHARLLYNERQSLPGTTDEYATFLGYLLDVDIETQAGNLVGADGIYRNAIDFSSTHGFSTIYFLYRIANCMRDRGELDAAERVLHENVVAEVRTHLFRLDLALDQGNIEEALSTCKTALALSTKESRDGIMFAACQNFTAIAASANDADRLPTANRYAILNDLAITQDLLSTVAGPNGPAWYPIQMRTLRAIVFSLNTDDLPQALTLARQALDLARQTYPDLVPETGRILTDHLLLAHQPDEVLALVAEIEPQALETGFFKERARLLANRVLALVQTHAQGDEIIKNMKNVRAALDATDSKRIKAETLRDFAARLPPTNTTPDPFQLAEEAHALFLEMPMPAQEARCLEIMGDALAARGKPDEAKVRYQTARARLERYGLNLRLPKITQKLKMLG